VSREPRAASREPRAASREPHDSARRLRELRDRRMSGDDIGLLFALTDGIHDTMTGTGGKALHEIATFRAQHVIVADREAVTVGPEYVATLPAAVIAAAGRLDCAKRASHCSGRAALMPRDPARTFTAPRALAGSGLNRGSRRPLLPIRRWHGHNRSTRHEIRRRTACVFFAGACDLISGHTGEQKSAYPSRPKTAAPAIGSMLDKVVPEPTVRDASEKTGRMITITTTLAERHRVSRRAHAITSPRVSVRAAIPASCAVPGVLSPVTLTAKTVHGAMHAGLPGRQRVNGAGPDAPPANRIADA